MDIWHHHVRTDLTSYSSVLFSYLSPDAVQFFTRQCPCLMSAVAQPTSFQTRVASASRTESKRHAEMCPLGAAWCQSQEWMVTIMGQAVPVSSDRGAHVSVTNQLFLGICDIWGLKLQGPGQTPLLLMPKSNTGWWRSALLQTFWKTTWQHLLKCTQTTEVTHSCNASPSVPKRWYAHPRGHTLGHSGVREK